MSAPRPLGLAALSDARGRAQASSRVVFLRDAAEALRGRLVEGPWLRRLTTLGLGEVALEAQAALAPLRWPLPFVTLARTAWLAEARADADGGARVLALVDPACPGDFARTPFGERFASRHPALAGALRAGPGLAEALRAHARSPEDVDLVALTDLAFTSVAGLMAALPRARIVVTRAAWAHALDAPPSARATLVRHLTRDVDEARLTLADDDLWLLPGLAFVHAPGLGPGSATVAACEAGRVRVRSSNGVALDAWTPYESRLPGLREAVRLRDVEVALRGDAACAASLAESMAFERALADRRPDAPAFHDLAPSLELTRTLRSPLGPTLRAHP